MEHLLLVLLALVSLWAIYETASGRMARGRLKRLQDDLQRYDDDTNGSLRRAVKSRDTPYQQLKREMDYRV
jgi:hypothetical protein